MKHWSLRNLSNAKVYYTTLVITLFFFSSVAPTTTSNGSSILPKSTSLNTSNLSEK
jgi:hypothetical protein